MTLSTLSSSMKRIKAPGTSPHARFPSLPEIFYDILSAGMFHGKDAKYLIVLSMALSSESTRSSCISCPRSGRRTSHVPSVLLIKREAVAHEVDADDACILGRSAAEDGASPCPGSFSAKKSSLSQFGDCVVNVHHALLSRDQNFGTAGPLCCPGIEELFGCQNSLCSHSHAGASSPRVEDTDITVIPIPSDDDVVLSQHRDPRSRSRLSQPFEHLLWIEV